MSNTKRTNKFFIEGIKTKNNVTTTVYLDYYSIKNRHVTWSACKQHKVAINEDRIPTVLNIIKDTDERLNDLGWEYILKHLVIV